MSGYLQRLIDTTPGILPAAPEPVVRTQSPIARHDQRLALDPSADLFGDVSTEVAPEPVADKSITPGAPAGAGGIPAAPAPPQIPPPVAVQRFQASTASTAAAVAPPPAPVSFAPAMPSAPLEPAGPSMQAGSALLRPAPHVAPVTIVNEFADTARPAPPHVGPNIGATPNVESDSPRAHAMPAPLSEPAGPAGDEKTPARRTDDELTYVSPTERMLEALPLARPAPPPDVSVEIAAAPDHAPAASARPVQSIPAREIRETIREIVREVASSERAPPTDLPRMPKTAAEASVIGPLGSPHAAARRLALMLR